MRNVKSDLIQHLTKRQAVLRKAACEGTTRHAQFRRHIIGIRGAIGEPVEDKMLHAGAKSAATPLGPFQQGFPVLNQYVAQARVIGRDREVKRAWLHPDAVLGTGP